MKTRINSSVISALLFGMGIYFLPVGAMAQTWINPAGGAWGDSGNWSGGIPNASDALADFSTLDLVSGVTVNVDGQYTVGGLVFGNQDANPAASWTVDNGGNAANNLNLSGSSGVATITVGDLGPGQKATISANLVGPSDLIVNGPGTLVLSGANTYASSGMTTVTNGATLVIGAANTLPVDTWLFLGDYDNGTVGNLDLQASQSVAALITQSLTGITNAIIPTNLINIASGQTLTVNGNVTLGFNPDVNTVGENLIEMSGGGSFVVNVDGGLFRVGAADIPAASAGTGTILDMSGLASANINLGANTSAGTSTLYVGDLSTVAALGGKIVSKLILADDTTVTANNLIVGSSQRFNPDILELGSGNNIFNVNSNLLGVQRDWGQVYFHTNAGSLKLRAADGVSPSFIGIGYNIAGANGATNQFMDFGNHYVDLLLSGLRVGYDRRGGYNSNYFGFANGILNTTELDIGIRSGNPSAAGTWISTCNIGGGTVIIGTNGIVMGTSAGTYASSIATNWAILNVSGGSVRVNGNIVLMTQKASTGNEQAISTLNITGGTNTVYGNIYCKKYVLNLGPHTSTLTLNGGVLDLTGHAIGGVDSVGSSFNQIPWLVDVINLQSGTLRNVNQINGGNTGLVKTGSGILTLAGTNTYTGGTFVNGGTLVVPNDYALGSSNVTVAGGSILELVGGLNNNYIYGGAELILNSDTSFVNLDFTGAPNHIAGLSFDGGSTFQATGTWGSSSSGAAHQDDIHFSGTGTILVTTQSSITLTSSLNPVKYGQAVTFTASVSGALGTPTGTVTFYNGANALGSGSLNGSGMASYSSSMLQNATNAITAVYNGDNIYSPITSAVLFQSVTPVPIALNGSNLTLQYAASIVGTNYVLVSSPSLAPPIVWTPVLTNAGTGGTLTFTIPFISGTTNQFFTYQLQ